MRDYLTGLAGLSEQYNAFQAMLGQAATMQQLQAASQSAAQQAALAQYIQVNLKQVLLCIVEEDDGLLIIKGVPENTSYGDMYS